MGVMLEIVVKKWYDDMSNFLMTRVIFVEAS